MTARLVLVNLSNYPCEDALLNIDGENVTIKPGEWVNLPTPHDPDTAGIFLTIRDNPGATSEYNPPRSISIPYEGLSLQTVVPPRKE